MPRREPGIRVRFWVWSPVYWLPAIVGGGALVVGVAFLVRAASVPAPDASAPRFFGVMAILAGLLPAGLGGIKLRPLVVADGRLKVPRGLRSTSIPLTSISGIGLLYQYMPFNGRVPRGWCLTVWGPGDERLRLDQYVVLDNNSSPPKDPGTPLPKADPVRLASSRPGRIAVRLSELTLAAQGEAGPYACESRQIAPPSDPRGLTTLGYWSPDGQMGRT